MIKVGEIVWGSKFLSIIIHEDTCYSKEVTVVQVEGNIISPDFYGLVTPKGN